MFMRATLTLNHRQGLLCLANNIGRYNHDIISGFSGQISIDLTAMPVNPVAAVMPGETWNLQCWYRDGNNNNFSDAVSVIFR